MNRPHAQIVRPARGLRLAPLLLGLGLLLACGPSTQAQRLVRVAEGFVQPVGIVAPGDGSGRLYVVEQRGTVAAWSPGEAPRAWLDLRDRVRAGGERGLLGLAFHPDFAENRRFFVHYTDSEGRTTLSELLADGDAGDPATEIVLFTLDQPFANHNGGQIAFGPDGRLYLGLGDGGGGGDPVGAGQDLSTPLGTLLRFDVDTGGRGDLRVPADNPFVDRADARPEIWAYGLRNPWRFSFDPESGDLWIADVGQNAVEEINRQPAGSDGGENYGWSVVEGDRCFSPRDGCDLDAFAAPVVTYTHASGWGRSVTGGVVPYGDAAPSLRGRYLFGDFVSGRVFVVDPDGAGGYAATPLLDAGFGVATFGLDAARDAYLADYGGGALYRFED